MGREQETTREETGKAQAAQIEETRAKTKFLPFEEARKFVRELKIKSNEKYNEWSKSGKRPNNIPANPYKVYKKEWNGWKNWLGTEFIPFEEAREFVHSLGFKSRAEWSKYCRSEKRLTDIPSLPNSVYKKEWRGWGDFLGTDITANQKRVYRSFEEAREFVHGLKLKNRTEYKKWGQLEKKPKDIPSSPDRVYKKEWRGWGDWLGNGRTRDFLHIQ